MRAADELGPGPRAHHQSHRALLKPLFQAEALGRGAIDAVIVPAGPGGRPLTAALDVAARLGCPLLVLCHPTINLDEVEAQGLAEGVRTYVAAALPPGGIEFPGSVVGVLKPSHKQHNIAIARCLGLLIARLAGWRRILWLDDDVHDVDVRAVRAAGRRVHLRGFACVGWSAVWFPDNSVVCHANRLAGNPQGCFVGSGMLVTAVEQTTPHFPAIYNDDWLFYFDLLRSGRVGYGGRVLQLPYDPFATHERAAEEEFGDLLAEGLFHLLHEVRDRARPATDLDRAATAEPFWRREIEFRLRFISRIADRLAVGEHSEVASPEQVDRAVHALRVASDTLARVHSAHVVDVVNAWRDDARTWASTLGSLYPLGSVLAAFDRLHITDHRPRTD